MPVAAAVVVFEDLVTSKVGRVRQLRVSPFESTTERTYTCFAAR